MGKARDVVAVVVFAVVVFAPLFFVCFFSFFLLTF